MTKSRGLDLSARLRKLIAKWRVEARSHVVSPPGGPLPTRAEYNRALRGESEARFADADELERELEAAVLAGPSAETRPESSADPEAVCSKCHAPEDWEEFAVAALTEGFAAGSGTEFTSFVDFWRNSHVRLQLEILGSDLQDFDSRFVDAEREAAALSGRASSEPPQETKR